MFWCLQGNCNTNILEGLKIFGADGGTRTPTVLPPTGPKPVASTSFATPALTKLKHSCIFWRKNLSGNTLQDRLYSRPVYFTRCFDLVRPEGFEPPTNELWVHCSNHWATSAIPNYNIFKYDVKYIIIWCLWLDSNQHALNFGTATSTQRVYQFPHKGNYQIVIH